MTPRDQLITIALDLLDEQHPEDLSLREVARRAGLTSGAPAHHFKNKLGLLAACAEVGWSDLFHRMHGAAGLEGKARAYIDFGLDRPGPYRLIMSRLFEGEDFPGITDWRKRVMLDVVDLIPPVAGDPRFHWRRAMAWWALLHGQVTLLLDGAVPDAKVEALTDDVCAMAAVIALLPASFPDHQV